MRLTAPLLLAACLLSACASSPDPVGETRARAWGQVLDQTSVTRMGGATLRATADTPLVRTVDEMELALLARIAGEAVALGAPRFVITFVDYDEASLGFGGDHGSGEAGWIGTYADLLEARSDADYDGSLSGAVGYKSMTAVVRLLAEGEEPGLPAFEAQGLYEALLADRIERGGVGPGRRLRLPRLRFD